MGLEEHKARAPKSVSVAIVTVSDTRTEVDDSSGHAIRELLEAEGHRIAKKVIVKDDILEIQRTLRGFIEDTDVEAIVMSGGTGLAHRDVTLEAVAHFEEKLIPGFGELFRMLSYEQIGSAAMNSRAEAFVSEGKLVFCLPGSEKAVRLAIQKLVAPDLGHLLWEARR